MPEEEIMEALEERNMSEDSFEFAAKALAERRQQSNLQEEPAAAAEEEELEASQEEEEVTELEEGEALEEEEVIESEESDEEVAEEEEVEEEGEELYVVTYDGEDHEVTLEKLRDGYLRQSDYTKKTQAVAEQRKAVEAQTVELTEAYTNLTKKAALVDALLERDLAPFKDVDWASLRAEDPVAYADKRIAFDEAQQARREVREQMQAVFEYNKKMQEDNAKQVAAAESKEALKLFPEWDSQEKALAGTQTIKAYAEKVGYTPQQIEGMVSARDMLVLDKARKWDELQVKNVEIAKKKKPGIRKMIKTKGVAPKSASRKKKLDTLQKQAIQDGSFESAAALLRERRK